MFFSVQKINVMDCDGLVDVTRNWIIWDTLSHQFILQNESYFSGKKSFEDPTTTPLKASYDWLTW